MNEYTYKIHNIIRRDFITRTLIIIVLKYNLKKTPQFVEFNQIKMEIEKTISLMTGNINQNFVKKLFEGIDRINSDENKDIYADIISEKNSIDENENKIESDQNSFSEEENIFKDISNKDALKDNNIEFNLSFDFEYSKNNISNHIELSDENNKKDDIDINKIIKERGYLNIFTLEKSLRDKLKKILINDEEEEDEDLGSLLDRIQEVNLNKNDKKKEE